MHDVTAIVVCTEERAISFTRKSVFCLCSLRDIKIQATNSTAFPYSARMSSGIACSIRKRHVPCSMKCCCRYRECMNNRSITRSSVVRKALSLVRHGRIVCLLLTSRRSTLVQNTHLLSPEMSLSFRVYTLN